MWKVHHKKSVAAQVKETEIKWRRIINEVKKSKYQLKKVISEQNETINRLQDYCNFWTTKENKEKYHNINIFQPSDKIAQSYQQIGKNLQNDARKQRDNRMKLIEEQYKNQSDKIEKDMPDESGKMSEPALNHGFTIVLRVTKNEVYHYCSKPHQTKT